MKILRETEELENDNKVDRMKATKTDMLFPKAFSTFFPKVKFFFFFFFQTRIF